MQPLIVPAASCTATATEVVHFVIAYAELLTACWQARAAGRSPREEPVRLAHLSDRGVPYSVPLWILFQGHVEHLVCPHTAADTKASGARLGEASLLALTPAGEAFADSWLLLVLCSPSGDDFRHAWELLRVGDLLPCYERRLRLFRWGQHILKCFRQPALNQELILSAAEEMGWPDWFDDPLPRRAGTSPKAILHDTIKDLNRRQRAPLVHFMGDGTGMRVGWGLR
jgi:hypothetical protein